jgi:hypothetical protein
MGDTRSRTLRVRIVAGRRRLRSSRHTITVTGANACRKHIWRRKGAILLNIGGCRFRLDVTEPAAQVREHLPPELATMRITRSFAAASLLAACFSPAAAHYAPAPPADLPLTPELLELQARHAEPAITGRRFTHAELWDAIGPVIDASGALTRDEIGRSAEGRPLYAVRFGNGPTRVLLWSQMHGDESTATMALADIFRFLAAEPDHPLAARLRERLTVTFVPMLNPDGAERFQRRNAYGVDVNRDAVALATPEARALKGLQQSFRPHFGFNLHDQNVRTRVGDSERLAAIALLAPAFDESRAMNEGRARAVAVASVIRNAVEPLVAGHVARYDDTFNRRAFGDLMQAWGVSTVLIESGGWMDDPEKQYLRRVNFVALLTALDAIGGGEYASADPLAYESLPYNGRSVNDLLIRAGTLVIPGLEPTGVDVAVDFADPLARIGGRVIEIGDLSHVSARDTLEAAGLYLHPDPDTFDRSAGRPVFGPGAPATFTIRRGADPASEAKARLVRGVPAALR